MIRLLIFLAIAILVIALVMYIYNSMQRSVESSRHRNWIPGSRPMKTPPVGKKWSYDTDREEWYLEDV